LLVLYAAQSTFFAIYSTSLKFGWAHAARNMQRFVPLSNDTNIVQLAAEWGAIVLFVMTALRLVRCRPALGIYAAAFALSAGNWLSFKLGTVYDQTFTVAEQKLDYLLLAAMMWLGLAIWMLEREARVAMR